MSQRIYLDDCAYAKPLVQLLRNAGHDVITPIEAGIDGSPDPLHLQWAVAERRILLTCDVDDFAVLHQSNPQHFGILVVCQDNDSTKDMTWSEIVKAIHNLVQSGVPIQGQYWILNAWRY